MKQSVSLHAPYVCLLVPDVAESNSATADRRCSPYTGAGSEDRISPFSAIYARQRFPRRRSSRYRPAPICQCRLTAIDRFPNLFIYANH